MFKQMEKAGLQDLHFCNDPDTGLQAIIAIHDTFRGPAIGGCRVIPYPSTEAAIEDAIRLAKGMSYKAALAGLPHGGGKAVIIKPEKINDRPAMMQSFGRFIDTLGGRYITAMDSGSQIEDMDNIAHATRYVTCTSHMGDPSPATASGVFAGIRATIGFKLGRDDLVGIHVALQGLGHVGYEVARLLFHAGARLTVSDIDALKVAKACKEFNANAINPQEIYSAPVDLFCPCGLGAIINEDTINQFRCRCIAGSANNQLANDAMGQELLQRGILYAPDYLINSGGLIFVALQHARHPDSVIQQKVAGIHDALLELYQNAAEANLPTNLIADQRAEAILNRASLKQYTAA
ncbi:Leu/Phe/Val dehydrogenase [Amphritea sp. HPY]|uniref:Leu/Phe/Val dehydrogenase n=1 Tax=Amphritea sp. HPY TaxID=3421652 RepID=UPI003D7D1572